MTKEQIETFNKISEPLMTFLKGLNPHASVIVTSEHTELVFGECVAHRTNLQCTECREFKHPNNFANVDVCTTCFESCERKDETK